MAKTTIKKPTLDTAAALGFAEGPTRTRKDKTLPKGKKTARRVSQEADSKSGLVPTGDVRLTANISEDRHRRLKYASADLRMPIGEIIEALVDHYLEALHKKNLK